MSEHFVEEHPFMKPLSEKLSEKRFKHTMRVAGCAHNLAKDHQSDAKSAVIAALLHDCAKNYDDKKLLKLAKKYDIVPNEAELGNPDLLHAKVGAYEAIHRYHVTKPDVFNAIYYHTTGRPSMSMLEKITYIADYIEPKRKDHGQLTYIRELAHIDLDQCMAVILGTTIDYLSTTDRNVDPLTQEAFDYYKQFMPSNQ